MSRPPLSPSDAAVALRSLPRRFRAALAAPSGEDRPDDLAHRPGADGQSPADHLVAATTAMASMHRTLDQVLVHDDPEVPRSAPEPGPVGGAAGSRPVEDLFADLGDEAGSLADRVAGVAAEDWRRSAHTPDGTTVGALDLVAEAVGTAVDRLRAAEATMAELRRS
jgi:hypothetical protein